MPIPAVEDLVSDLSSCAAERASIVVGVTSHETCHALKGRLKALREAGFKVTLICRHGALFDRIAADEKVDSIAIPMKREIAPISDLISLFRIWRVLRRLRPDMVEFGTPKAGLLGTIAARLCGVPRRVYMLRGLRLETATGLKRRILLAAERMASRCAHVVVCNSGSLRAQALALGVAPASKLHLLGEGSSHGVDTEQYSPGESDVRSRYDLPSDAKVVGFVGRLTRDKGVPELVEAFDTILRAEPKAHLLLVGWFDASDDLLGNDVRVKIENHSRIHLTGFQECAADFYRAMDVMVLPTWREGFPNVVLEAAATGIPVVTTLSTGSRDSVVPEVTGLLIPPGYPEAISEAVVKLLRDPERRLRMGQAGRAWVLEHFNDERVLGLTAAHYKSLLEPAARGLAVRNS
ncbi:MAG: glycosyltransferase family 4 protein [Terracidiphilus sp.]